MIAELHALLDAGEDAIAADWCEDHGWTATAATLRWLVGQSARPREAADGCWWYSTIAPWDGRLAPYDVPTAAYNRMDGGQGLYPTGRGYGTRALAILALAQGVIREREASRAKAT